MLDSRYRPHELPPEVRRNSALENAGLAAFVMALHLLVGYLWVSIDKYRGRAFLPGGLDEIPEFVASFFDHARESMTPTVSAILLYVGFVASQIVFAIFLPGRQVKGLPVEDEGGKKLAYICNGALSWYATIAALIVLHVTGLVPITLFFDNLGPMLGVAVIVADLSAVVALLMYRRTRAGIESVQPLRDLLVGVWLNPRIGRFDLKFFSISRCSYFLLFTFAVSAFVRDMELHGRISWSLALLVTAVGLYANACAKGEECLPASWDIFHEKWGWNTIFWNYVIIPWVYGFNIFYLVVNPDVEHSATFIILLFVILIAAYYVWDTAQSQKNNYRMIENGTYVKRRAFPQLPWGVLKCPDVMILPSGRTLLVDGWWRYARKVNYTADMVMAVVFGLACGFGGAMPYLYPVAFIAVLLHRAKRDEARCEAKYGESWERYKETVPWKYIPHVH